MTIERRGVAVLSVCNQGLSASGVAITGRPIERRTQGSVRMVMVVIVVMAISIMQTGFTQRPLDFLAQRFGDERGVAFAASDPADVRRVHLELHGHALVNAAKNGERLYRVRDTIRVVTSHDFLGKGGSHIRHQS
jgi:hypothetical protein